MTTIDLVIEQLVRDAVAAEVARVDRPALVHQRTVERVAGVPRRDFLRLARTGAFDAWKERRLVYARTDDVVACIRRCPSPAAAANDTAEATSALDAALARAGARRVAA